MTYAVFCLITLGTLAVGPVPAQTAAPSNATSTSPAPPPRVVARVNGVLITADRFAMALDTLMPIASYHRNVDNDRLAQVRREALRNVIDEELQYQDAVRRGFIVRATEVTRSVTKARRSYKSATAWDADRRKAGVTLVSLRREIRRALMIRKAYERTVLATCRVSEAEASQFYKDNPDRFVMPEQRRVSLITLSVDPAAPRDQWQSARERAEAIRTQLAAGASFEALAKEHSTDASRDAGGDLGFIHRGRMSDEFEKALAELRPGDTSPVFETIYGVNLVRLAEVRPPELKSFADVKARLTQDLTDRQCAKANDEWTARLRARSTIAILDDSLR